MRFLGACDGRPVFYGRQTGLNRLPLEAHEVEIEDVRDQAGRHSLDVEGFRLLAHRSTVTNFLDPVQMQQRYRPEIEELVRQASGASATLAIHGVLRRSDRSTGFGAPGTTVVGRFVHCDYTPGPAGSSDWVRRLLPLAEAERRLQRRFAIYTLWRVLTEPPQDMPLALCDARSVAPGDRQEADGVSDSPGEPEKRYALSLFRHNPAHRWCYFRDMTPDQLLIFKGYDSDPARASGVPHGAFDDPSWSGRGQPRESSDYRVIAFFDE